MDKLPLYDFGYAKSFRNQKVFKTIATCKVRDENINFKSNRTSSMSGKKQTKQSLLSPRISSSHQTSKYHTNTTSKLNQYINKLTLPYFSSFCQPFHISFFYNIFDQRLFCCYEELFFQPVHIKISFLPRHTIGNNHTGLYLSSVKKKEKMRRLIGFKSSHPV